MAPAALPEEGQEGQARYGGAVMAGPKHDLAAVPVLSRVDACISGLMLGQLQP